VFAIAIVVMRVLHVVMLSALLEPMVNALTDLHKEIQMVIVYVNVIKNGVVQLVPLRCLAQI